MSEGIQLRDPLYKLIIRFSNGELVHYIVQEPLDVRAITPETRYALISSVFCERPNECADMTVVNMRDVTFIKTERVTLDQLAAEHRIGIRTHASDEKQPKTVSQVKFI
jgi:hypothetical protein